MTRWITDLHVHSRFSRGTSREMTLETMARWAVIKGLDLLGTGDFTHPGWMRTLRRRLTPTGDGIYESDGARFLLTAELSVLWRQGDRGRRVHLLVLAPSLEAAQRITRELDSLGKLASDGRPMLKASAPAIVEAIWNTAPSATIIPAHVWTPWYGAFGAKSGFDSLEECFGPHAERILSLETGLSSDPAMNRLLSSLDRLSLVSFSDAHSPSKLGREGTLFELSEISYPGICSALRTGAGYGGTIEFYPEKGKYHYDGHRACGAAIAPSETAKHGGRCPVCGKQLTVGVLHRVTELADRSEPQAARVEGSVRHLVPLAEILSQALGVGEGTKTVARVYASAIARFGTEFSILLDRSLDELQEGLPAQVVEGISRVRAGDLQISPGYDGVYGKIGIPFSRNG